LGIFGSLLTTGTRDESIRSLLTESSGNLKRGRYGLLAIGNGQALGTEMGLGIAGAGVAVTGFDVLRRWTAGVAVFFFAAFLIAGFLAGFFLPAFLAAFLAAVLPAFFSTPLAADLRDACFRAALRDWLDLATGFFLRASALRTTFFFDVFFTLFFALVFALVFDTFFATVLAFAITTSNYRCDSG
jgi:hypothetical protein